MLDIHFLLLICHSPLAFAVQSMVEHVTYFADHTRQQHKTKSTQSYQTKLFLIKSSQSRWRSSISRLQALSHRIDKHRSVSSSIIATHHQHLHSHTVHTKLLIKPNRTLHSARPQAGASLHPSTSSLSSGTEWCTAEEKSCQAYTGGHFVASFGRSRLVSRPLSLSLFVLDHGTGWPSGSATGICQESSKGGVDTALWLLRTAHR